jgi:hypothetical protein
MAEPSRTHQESDAMRLRYLLALALLVPAGTAAAAPEPASPALLVRMKPLDAMIEDFQFLGGLVDQEDKAKEIEGFVRSLLGPKAFDGIDAKRPLAVYGTFTADARDATAVALLPVGDPKVFLDVLDRFKVKAEKGAGDIYTLSHPDLPPVLSVYLRFAHKYAYVTFRSPEAIKDGKLIPADKLFDGSDPGLVSVALRLDAVPVVAKQLALQQAELQLANAKEKQPGESDAQTALKRLAVDAIAFRIKQLINEGKELSLKLDVDRKKNDLTGGVTLTAKDGSALSADVKSLGASRSLLAGLLVPEAALNFGLNVGLPADLKKALGPVVDEAVAQAKDKAEGPAKELAEKLLASIEPTLKAGELDMAMSFRGPDAKGRLTLVTGLKVQGGKGIEKSLRDVVDALPEQAKERIKLDVATAGGAKIHKVVGGDDADANAVRLFGPAPDLYLAFRDDAAFIAIGANGLEDLKVALAATPKSAAMLQADLAAGRAYPFQEQADKQKLAKEIAGKVFGADAKGNDVARFTVTGGDALTASFSLKGGVVTFLALFDAAQKAKDKPAD